MNISTRFKNLSGGSLISLLIGMAGSVQGANELNLSNSPLFLGDSVDPNVFIELDDSGSMDWDVLTSKYWHYCAFDSNALGSAGDGDCGWLIDNGLLRLYARTPAGADGGFQDFEYIFDSPDDAYGTSCTGDRQTLELCGDDTNNADWRARAAAVNVMYFNGEADYQPWPGMDNASFSAAHSNPQPGTVGHEAATRDLGANGGFTYHVWQDTKGYSGDRPRRGDNINVTGQGNGEVDLWDDHIEFNVTGANVRYRKITYAPDDDGMNPTVSAWIVLGVGEQDPVGQKTPAEIRQNIANWYQYGRRRSFVAKGATGTVVNQLPGFRYGLSVINDFDRLNVPMPEAAETDYTDHNADMLDDLYSFEWHAHGTPLRRGLERVGEYYKTTGDDAPITHSCQQNFTILFTDGYWNGGNPLGAINDADGDGLSETLADVAYHYYKDDLRDDLTDDVTASAEDPVTHQHMVTFTVAFGVQGHLQDTNNDGWPDKDGAGNDYTPKIDGDWGDPIANADSPEKVDDLWHAAFNSAGKFIAANTPQEVVRAQEKALKVITARTSSAASVALNSGSLGSNTNVFQARFYSGDWSGQLLSYKIDADGSIAKVPTWDAGEKLDGQQPDSRVIVTFRPGDDGAGTGVKFRFPADYTNPGDQELSSTQLQALMATMPYPAPADAAETASNQAYGQALLNFLRGDRSNEGDAIGYKFRERGSALGDVVHSDPVFVGPPNLRYPDYWRDLLDPEADQPENAGASYSAFRTAYTDRTPLIFFGANDGMLHAVNATDTLDVDGDIATTDISEGGAELLAYVPSKVYLNLPELANPEYLHKYFVNGPPTVVDAFFDGAWHTVLVGGMAGGGQGIYALDVTNPANFSEANASSLVMWEFTDADSGDLGYTYSRPAVVRLHNGKWGVVLGNGYNNTEADGAASGSGNAVLYILDISSGEVLKAIDTGIGAEDDPAGTDRPNGLATPAPIDLDRDGIVDYVYAGDLFGNMWKFDLTAKSADDWAIAKYPAVDGSAQPLFKAVQGAEHQAITTRPEVGVAPFGQAGVMVYFGTGQYLEVGDNTPLDQVTQSFYGVWDTGIVVTRDELQEQQILQETEQDFYDVDGNKVDDFELRVTSDTPVSWRSELNPAGDLGWYMDLVNQEHPANNKGERQVSNSVLRNDRIIFTTLLPSEDPCEFGGTSWLMELDAFSGARLPYSPFDLNLDGAFGEEDYVCTENCNDDDTKVSVAASGKKSKVGIIPTPGILSGGVGGQGGSGGDGDKKKVNPCEEGAECKLASGSTGAQEQTRENPGRGDYGRQSWHEL